MFKYKFILAVFCYSTLSIAGPTHSSSSCAKSLTSALNSVKALAEEFKIGESYWIQFRKDPSIRWLRFDGEVSTPAGARLQWSEQSSNKNIQDLAVNLETRDRTVYRVRAEGIKAYRREQPRRFPRLRPLLETLRVPFSFLQIADILGQLIYTPYRRLSSVEPSVVVYGELGVSASAGDQMARDIFNFDQEMLSLGFKRPNYTRIIVARKPLIPSLTGPFYLEKPTINFPNFSPMGPTIALKPLFWNTCISRTKTSILHERSHSLLRVTFDSNSYINKNQMVQEGLSDFLSAQHSETPLIGGNTQRDGTPLRDIDLGRSYRGKDLKYDEISSPIQAQLNAEHKNSLLYSQILWRLNSVLGAATFRPLILPLLENLNRYHWSYERRLSREEREPHRSYPFSITYDLEFLLAMILKTGAETHPTIDSELAQAVQQIIDESEYASMNRLRQLSQSLIPEMTEHKLIPEAPVAQFIGLSLFGATGVVLRISAAYWLIDQLIPY